MGGNATSSWPGSLVAEGGVSACAYIYIKEGIPDVLVPKAFFLSDTFYSSQKDFVPFLLDSIGLLALPFHPSIHYNRLLLFHPLYYNPLLLFRPLYYNRLLLQSGFSTCCLPVVGLCSSSCC